MTLFGKTRTVILYETLNHNFSSTISNNPKIFFNPKERSDCDTLREIGPACASATVKSNSIGRSVAIRWDSIEEAVAYVFLERLPFEKKFPEPLDGYSSWGKKNERWWRERKVMGTIAGNKGDGDGLETRKRGEEKGWNVEGFPSSFYSGLAGWCHYSIYSLPNTLDA